MVAASWLPEVTEATWAVLCEGDEVLLDLVTRVSSSVMWGLISRVHPALGEVRGRMDTRG